MAIVSVTLTSVQDIEPRLATAIEKRLRELHLSPTDFADQTGLTPQGLLPLRKGYRRHYQHRLTDPVCRVLGWTPDSIERILAGKKPTLLKPVSPPDELAALQAQVRRHEERIDTLESRLLRLLEVAVVRVEGDVAQPPPSSPGETAISQSGGPSSPSRPRSSPHPSSPPWSA